MEQDAQWLNSVEGVNKKTEPTKSTKFGKPLLLVESIGKGIPNAEIIIVSMDINCTVI